MIDENIIKTLQQRVQASRIKEAKAEAEEEAAKRTVTELKTKLKEDFGVSTGAEIREKLESLKAEEERLLAEAESKLEEAGA